MSLNLCIPVAILSLLKKTEHDTDSITLEKNPGHSHSSKYVRGIYAGILTIYELWNRFYLFR